MNYKYYMWMPGEMPRQVEPDMHDIRLQTAESFLDILQLCVESFSEFHDKSWTHWRTKSVLAERQHLLVANIVGMLSNASSVYLQMAEDEDAIGLPIVRFRLEDHKLNWFYLTDYRSEMTMQVKHHWYSRLWSFLRERPEKVDYEISWEWQMRVWVDSTHFFVLPLAHATHVTQSTPTWIKGVGRPKSAIHTFYYGKEDYYARKHFFDRIRDQLACCKLESGVYS